MRRQNSRAAQERMPHTKSIFHGVSVMLVLLLFSAAFQGLAQQPEGDSALTAHEWGTFTSVAGTNGGAVRWLALTGASDLPGFVEHLNGPYLKLGLSGTLRMETPVLYFYTTRETEVSVRVQFAKGLITEWYPHASRVEPSGPPTEISLHQNQSPGS